MEIFIGTSGWQYNDWNKRFYPDQLKNEDKLPYYSEFFKTVEINSTFYHMPLEKSVQRWYDDVPKGFVFSVKMNRYVTHTKRLLPNDETDQTLQQFYDRLSNLREKLGVILVQLPPSMKADVSRLEHFAAETKKAEKRHDMRFALAFEFRHESWFSTEVMNCLRVHNIATVNNDAPTGWAVTPEITADTAYIRFHGSKHLYRSRYSHKELAAWATFIAEECRGCQRVFAFFNNDYNAVAIANARMLAQLAR